MNRHFISGGTTGTPKQIKHDSIEWRYIILDTALVMRQLGVSEKSVVLIAQPSFPWAIGQAFADAAIVCGADAICFGLHSDNAELYNYWNSLNVTHIVAPPSLLVKICNKFKGSFTKTTILSVGEPLSDSQLRNIQKHGTPNSLRSIYGLSELGTISYQISDESKIMALNPRFKYRLDASNTSNTEGVLIIESYTDQSIIRTNDHVKFNEPIMYNGLWSNSIFIHIIGRTDNVIYLSDGSAINEQLVYKIKEYFNLDDVQFVIRKDKKNDIIFVRYSSDRHVEKKTFVSTLIDICPEIQDNVLNSTLKFELINCDLTSFITNERGKSPKLFESKKI